MGISLKRLKSNILSLGEIGKDRELALDVTINRAGNVIGRKRGRNDSLPVVITGSNIDSVKNGGLFAGSLDVLSAIEVMESINEDGIHTDRPIEVVSFSDEEDVGFKKGTIRSQAFLGKFDEKSYFGLKDDQGITLKDVMEDFGLNPMEIRKTSRKAERRKLCLNT